MALSREGGEVFSLLTMGKLSANDRFPEGTYSLFEVRLGVGKEWVAGRGGETALHRRFGLPEVFAQAGFWFPA